MYLRRRTVAFVVRIWVEYLEQIPPSWRGEAECIDSGERRVFGDVEELIAFLQSQSATPPEKAARK